MDTGTNTQCFSLRMCRLGALTGRPQNAPDAYRATVVAKLASMANAAVLMTGSATVVIGSDFVCDVCIKALYLECSGEGSSKTVGQRHLPPCHTTHHPTMFKVDDVFDAGHEVYIATACAVGGGESRSGPSDGAKYYVTALVFCPLDSSIEAHCRVQNPDFFSGVHMVDFVPYEDLIGGVQRRECSTPPFRWVPMKAFRLVCTQASCCTRRFYAPLSLEEET